MYDPKVLAGLRASALNKRGRNVGNTKPVVKAAGKPGSKRAIRRGA